MTQAVWALERAENGRNGADEAPRLTPTQKRILAVLTRSGGFATYDVLAREALGYLVPVGARSAVTQHGVRLRARGYPVRAVMNLGLELVAEGAAPRRGNIPALLAPRIPVACPECGRERQWRPGDIRAKASRARFGVYGFCSRTCRTYWRNRLMRERREEGR